MSAAALAERQLVGAVLWSAHGGARLPHLAEMVSGLAVDDFTDPEIRRVLETIRLLIAEDRTPIPAVIVPKMIDAGLLPEQLAPIATGLVCDLIGEAPAVVMWPELKQTVKEWSARRRVARSGVRLREAAGRSPDLADLRRLVASEADAARDALAVVA